VDQNQTAVTEPRMESEIKMEQYTGEPTEVPNENTAENVTTSTESTTTENSTTSEQTATPENPEDPGFLVKLMMKMKNM